MAFSKRVSLMVEKFSLQLQIIFHWFKNIKTLTLLEYCRLGDVHSLMTTMIKLTWFYMFCFSILLNFISVKWTCLLKDKKVEVKLNYEIGCECGWSLIVDCHRILKWTSNEETSTIEQLTIKSLTNDHSCRLSKKVISSKTCGFIC